MICCFTNAHPCGEDSPCLILKPRREKMPACLPFRPFATSASAVALSGPGLAKSLPGFSGNIAPCTCAYNSGRWPD